MAARSVARTAAQDGDAHLLRPRPYQMEMLEESLKRNVIVAMETGSGKTLVQAELERCPQHQTVWFLAPKVALAEQQANVLKLSLPSYEQRFLCGADGVDKWSTLQLWDAVLKNVRIVVCTPAVLLDALTHGFVKLADIALMVFDEGKCTGKHAMNQIMRSFYAHRKRLGQPVPSILALTASPVKEAGEHLVREIESNLDATITTPTLHRVDLQASVNRPETSIRVFTETGASPLSEMVNALRLGLIRYDLHQDPYVLELKRLGESMESPKLSKVFLKRKTSCLEQLKKLMQRATELESELGPAMAEWYLRQCADKLRNIYERGNLTLLSDWKDEEKVHLLTLMGSWGFFDDPHCIPQQLWTSAKYQRLLRILRDELIQNFTCIIFAKQRATVAALAEALSGEKIASQNSRIGSFVGSSANVARSSNISDLTDLRNQQAFLDGFRAGLIDVIVSTDVLEEGIDVPACNLVICYDPPSNLISFVQRRGRARQELSRYTLLFPAASASVNEWHKAEHVLTQIHADERRRFRTELEKEDVYEESDRELRIEETSALLTLDNALSHLSHFCDTLRRQYVDPTPVFTVQGERMRTANVQLPASLDASLRFIKGSKPWQSERRAKQDAAFEACKALHGANLLNDHFLPAIAEAPVEPKIESDTPAHSALSMMYVNQVVDVWQSIRRAWNSASHELHGARLKITAKDGEDLFVGVVLPCRVPDIEELKLYWNDNEPLVVNIEQRFILDRRHLNAARQAAGALLKAAFTNHSTIDSRQDYAMLFLPNVEPQQLSQWANAARLYQLVEASDKGEDHPGLMVYDRFRGNTPQVTLEAAFEIPTHDMSPDAQLHRPLTPERCLRVRRLPRSRDFRQSQGGTEYGPTDKWFTGARLIPLRNLTTNGLLCTDVKPACFIPVLTHHIQNMLVAEHLQSSLLEPAQMKDTNLVLEAITTPLAGEPQNYERLEFLGDCVLKLLASLQLMAEHSRMPESQLTALKSKLVSNDTLARAACEVGIDRFIIQYSFHVKAIHPPHVGTALENTGGTQGGREISSKVIADVTEALIGAAYTEGLKEGNADASEISMAAGLTKALKCLQVLMPTRGWFEFKELTKYVLDSAAISVSEYDARYGMKSNEQIGDVERIIGHCFKYKSLVDSARTHPSFTQDPMMPTYDRLEFLGDALLDVIVTTRVFVENPSLRHFELHSLRQACVNGDTLAYMAMSTGIGVQRHDISDVNEPRLGQLSVMDRVSKHRLWHFMRRTAMNLTFSLDLAEAQNKHDRFRGRIDEVLSSGTAFPWADVMSVGAPKCVSDLIESFLAAIWLDSESSADETFMNAEAMVDRFGLMPMMRHLAADKVEVIDPKQRLHTLAQSERLTFKELDEAGEERALTVDAMALSKNERTITCHVAGIEVARMQASRVTKSEAMNAGKVGLINQYRLCDIAIEQWYQPGGGAEVMQNLKKQRTDAKAAEAIENEDVDDSGSLKLNGQHGEVENVTEENEGGVRLAVEG